MGYSNGDAHKKISACKLASHCKGVKESIACGELSLSNAASVQVFLNQNAKLQSKEGGQLPKETEKKISSDQIVRPGLSPQLIIERIKNKSTRECEAELEKIASENHLKLPEKKPSKRNYGDKTLLKVYLDRDKLQLLKSRLNIPCEQELLQALTDEKLKATEPRTEVKPKARKQPSHQSLNIRPRSISPSKRAIVFERAEKKCENCGSEYRLHIDHKVSVAKGGGNELKNLRVLCQSCNQRAAVEQLGLAIMDKFINRKSVSINSTK